MLDRGYITFLMFCFLLLAACGQGNVEVLPTATPTLEPVMVEQQEEVTQFSALEFEAAWQVGQPPTYADSSALTVSEETVAALSQGKAAVFSFARTEVDKAIFFVEEAVDLSSTHFFQITLVNHEAAIAGAALSLSTGSDWVWHETQPVATEVGTNKLIFDLTADNFFTDKAQNTTVANLDAVQRLALILYPVADGSVTLTNLGTVEGPGIVASETASLTRPPAATTPTTTPTPLPTLNPEEVELGLKLRQARVASYDMLTLDLDTNVPFNNPFDMEQVKMQLHFTAPSGEVTTVGAFWYEAWQGVPANGPVPDGQWLARFTPIEVGEWQVSAELPAYNVVTEAQAFLVTPSDNPGFIGIDPDNPRYLVFDDGSPLLTIGTNIAWYRSEAQALRDYERWFDKLAANGGNTVRIWMAPWAFALEWRDTPLGDYSNRMKQAWLLDQVFTLAAERNINIILVLINHGQFALNVNPEWNDNPYNVANGGMLETPQEFVTDPQAQALFKQRLTYIGNRYSHYTNLLAWEWWNEINWTPITDEALIPWLQEMTTHLQAHDPYNHLTTTSGHAPRSAVWQQVDIVQKHEYNTRDVLTIAPFSMREYNEIIPDKPIAFTEFGFSPADGGINFERTGIHLHNGLWVTALSGYTGTGMYWWWDTYIEPNDLWYHFDSIHTFLAGEDISTYTPFSPLEIEGIGETQTMAVGLGMRSEQAILLWLRDRDYTTQAAQRAYEDAIVAGTAADFWYEPEPVSDQQLSLPEVPDGDYVVRWYNPQTIEWLGEEVVTAENNSLTIPIPTFTRDIAAQIIYP